MTTAYSISIPKADLKLKKVAEFSTGIFIDNSGSTCGQLVSVGKTILQAETSICENIRFDSIVLWNSSAELCRNIATAKASGGTSPESIFKNTATRDAFNNSDVIVFVTDGEIDQSSVTKFASYTKDNLNKALVICVIVNKKLASPSKINVSVVAPLMVAANVLCLFYDGETFYILSSKGYINHFYKSSDNLTDYTHLNTLNINELFHNVQVYEYAKIPDGYIGIRENEHEIIALDFNKFISSKDPNFVTNIDEEEWKTLIQYAKIGNKLSELRTFVTLMKNEAIRGDMATIKQTFDFKYSKQRDEIVAKIIALKIDDNAETNQLHLLRQQLHEITDSAKIEELEYMKYVNVNLHKTRQFWNHIQSMIHEQEIGSYSINDFTFASNRANRAKMTTAGDDDDPTETLNILDHDGVPMFECAICMEQGPQVLWLKTPANLDDSTNDYVINFPLQRNEKLHGCLVSNPVCGLCAKVYTNAATTANGLLTLYREPCSGFIPLKWSSPSNRKYANYILYCTLTGNKILHHVSMLLLALVDDFKVNWLSEQTKTYFIRQLIENIYTTDSFAEEGTRMPMINALKEILKQEDKLMRQPFTAVCRLLNFNYVFHQLDIHTIVSLLRKRFILMCIETQCLKTKFGPEYLTRVKQQLYEIIFDTFCGIPRQNSFRQIQLDNEQFREFLGNNYDGYIQAIDTLANNIHSDHSKLLPDEIVSFILYLLTTVLVHDRPMKLYTDFALKHRIVRNDMQIPWSQTNEKVNKEIFGDYHQPLTIASPSYAINLGRFSCPSKLFFLTEPLWDQNIEYQHINVTTLTNQLKVKLDQKIKECYGNTVPSPSSGHFLLHKIVAEVLDEHYPQDEKLTAQMVMDCMMKLGQTSGKKGNIYAEHVFPSVVVTIEDFLRFRRSTPNRIKINDEQTSRSYQYKIIAELLTNGMEYNETTNEVYFDVSRIQKPRLLDINTTTIDFAHLKVQVQQLYSATKATTQVNRTCLNIEIKDFIEFGYKMNADALLPIWAQEQQNIVSSIITDVDRIEQPIKYVAGLDISFVKTNDKAVASMVIFDYQTLDIVAKISVNCNMKIPYIAGYLAFREAPVFMKIIDILNENCPELTPQVILMDGNGIWHPRRAGIASHFGVLSGIPCFGVSKNVLVADGITQERVEALLTEKASEENQFVEVIGDSGALLGLAYNVTGFVKNAVYISAGHKITLQTACEIFKKVTKYRITEPIRQADLLSRELVAKLA